jgi:hypothetical protein
MTTIKEQLFPLHFHICGKCDRRIPGWNDECTEASITMCSFCLAAEFPKAKIVNEMIDPLL